VPLYSDTPKVITISSVTDTGITVLVRHLGILRWSSLWKFVGDIEVDADNNFSFDCVIKFWNNDFSVQSSTITFTDLQRKIITFEDFVFCGNEDKFYVTIEVTDWNGNTSIEFTIHNSYLVKGLDSLLINDNGNLLRDEHNYNSSLVLDLIDAEFDSDFGTPSYEALADSLSRDLIQGHLAINKIDNAYPRAFADGNFRVFNNEGDSMIVVSFDHNNGIDTETINVTYLTGTDEVKVTTSLGDDTLSYTGPDFYNFQITSGGDIEDIKVWVDVEKSADPGPVNIDDIDTTVVRKYLKGSLVAQNGFNFIDRGEDWFDHYRPKELSRFEETLTFSFVGPDWEAALTYDAIEDKDLCLLLRDGIPIPDTFWDFVDSDMISLDNAEFDSTATYIFRYKLDISMTMEIDISGYTGIDEFYLLPLVDIFNPNRSLTGEVDIEETVNFDSAGDGTLNFFSNERIEDVEIRRVDVDRIFVLPADGIVELINDTIRINPFYYSGTSYYVVSYKGLLADVDSYADVIISWQYQKEDTTWSSFVEWDRRTLVPHRYFETTVKNVQKIRLRAKVNTENELLFLRGMGLVFVSLRAGEIM
jgi:hypothetical protein